MKTLSELTVPEATELLVKLASNDDGPEKAAIWGWMAKTLAKGAPPAGRGVAAAMAQPAKPAVSQPAVAKAAGALEDIKAYLGDGWKKLTDYVGDASTKAKAYVGNASATSPAGQDLAGLWSSTVDPAAASAGGYLKDRGDIAKFLLPKLLPALGGAAVGGLAGLTTGRKGRRMRDAFTGLLAGGALGAGGHAAYQALAGPAKTLDTSKSGPGATEVGARAAAKEKADSELMKAQKTLSAAMATDPNGSGAVAARNALAAAQANADSMRDSYLSANNAMTAASTSLSGGLATRGFAQALRPQADRIAGAVAKAPDLNKYLTPQVSKGNAASVSTELQNLLKRVATHPSEIEAGLEHMRTGGPKEPRGLAKADALIRAAGLQPLTPQSPAMTAALAKARQLRGGHDAALAAARPAALEAATLRGVLPTVAKPSLFSAAGRGRSIAKGIGGLGLMAVPWVAPDLAKWLHNPSQPSSPVE